MSSEKVGPFGAFSSTSSSSTATSSGFSFKPSALAPLTTHINTKVVTNQNSDVETLHTPAVLKFLSSKPEDRLNDMNDNDKKDSDDSNSKPSFVFGKNIDTRVVNAPHSPEPGTTIEKQAESSPKKEEKPKDSGDDTSKQDEKGSIFLVASKGLLKPSPSDPSLNESSPVEKSVFQTPENLNVFNVNRLPPPVASVETGEENEDTLFHVVCKLHVFDSQKSTWLERGRGLVKINRDRTTRKCRIVMRQQGIYRLLLNSPIFAGMRLKQVSSRCLHVTAAEVDTGAMRVYLLTTSTPTETSHLHHFLSDIISDLDAGDSDSRHQGPAHHDADEWRAAEGTRSSKHGRSQEDISRLHEQATRTGSGALRRASACNVGDAPSDDSDDDSGHDVKPKRAFREQTHDSNNSNSCGSLEDGVDNSDEDVDDEDEDGSLDDSFSPSRSPSGRPSSASKQGEISCETSNASVDLKRPRLFGANGEPEKVEHE